MLVDQPLNALEPERMVMRRALPFVVPALVVAFLVGRRIPGRHSRPATAHGAGRIEFGTYAFSLAEVSATVAHLEARYGGGR